MKTHDVIQGSPEWHALRATSYNASDAPAMLGCSPYQTRTELIARLATGITPEVDAETQRRFDDGHRYEALARPLAAEVLGEDLYPISGSGEYPGLDKPLGASFDGATITDEHLWEHKSLNNELRAILPESGVGDFKVGASLPKMYRVQMEHQLLVNEAADDVLFSASKWNSNGELEEIRHCRYKSDPALRAEIIAGWKQLAEDVKAYVPVEVIEAKPVVSNRPESLPALHHEVTGALVLKSNIKEWETAARAYIQQVRDHELKTDEDFTAAAEAKDWCESTKTKLLGMRTSLMTKTGDVNVAVEALDRIMADLDATRISFTNAIKARKDARKEEIVADGMAKLKAHIEALNKRLAVVSLPAIAADFGGAIRGKSSLAKMEDAVSVTLANAKIQASEIADKIERNLKWLEQHAADFSGLFADRSTLVLKDHDDFVAQAQLRISNERARLDKILADNAAAARQKLLDDQAALQAQQQSTAAPAPASVHPFPSTPVVTQKPAAVIDNTARIKLGQINERIAPLSITAAGLTELGFKAAGKEGAAVMYLESDYPLICEALIQHLTQVADLQVA